MSKRKGKYCMNDEDDFFFCQMCMYLHYSTTVFYIPDNFLDYFHPMKKLSSNRFV